VPSGVSQGEATSAPENAPVFALIDIDTMLYLHAEAATAPVRA
jgi:hypothetical protein